MLKTAKVTIRYESIKDMEQEGRRIDEASALVKRAMKAAARGGRTDRDGVAIRAALSLSRHHLERYRLMVGEAIKDCRKEEDLVGRDNRTALPANVIPLPVRVRKKAARG